MSVFIIIIALLSILAIIAVGILLHLWCKAFKPTWYKPHFGIRLGNLDWRDVADCMTNNPLSFKTQCKPYKCLRPDNGFWLGLVYLFFIPVICFLPIYFLCSIEKSISNGQLSFFPSGALASAIVTLILGGASIFYNMRLQARATHRQKWIDEMRKTITKLLEILTCYGSEQKNRNRNGKENEIKAKYKKNMFRLELLINPSEKEHRALLALIRRGSIFTEDQKWGGLIEGIDDYVLYRLEKQVKLIQLDNNKDKDSKNIDPCLNTKRKTKKNNGKCKCKSCKERYENISYIIRLSNVVLKREWEQVKYVR